MASDWSWRDEDGRWHIDIDKSWDAVDAEEEAWEAAILAEFPMQPPRPHAGDALGAVSERRIPRNQAESGV